MKTRATMLRLLLVLALAATALGAFAVQAPRAAFAQQEKTCAGEPMLGSSGGAAASPAAAAMASPVAQINGSKLNIAFLPKDIVNPYFKAAAQGAQQAQKELNGQFQMVGPQTSSAAEQVTYVQTLTQQNVAAIAISGNDPNALAPALKDAMAKGIKVVSFDADVAQDARQVFVNQASSEDIGRIQVQIMGKLLNCKGNIAILSAASTMANQNTWIGYMKDELKKPGYENLKLVDIVYGNDDQQLSYDKTVELLTAYPDLKGIISPTTVGMTAAAAALEAEGRGGGSSNPVVLTGLDLPSLARQYVKSGTVKEFALWNVNDLGYLTYWVCAHLINGDITGKQGETFTAGRLGQYTIRAKGEVLLGPPFIFNAENIDQFTY